MDHKVKEIYYVDDDKNEGWKQTKNREKKDVSVSKKWLHVEKKTYNEQESH